MVNFERAAEVNDVARRRGGERVDVGVDEAEARRLVHAAGVCEVEQRGRVPAAVPRIALRQKDGAVDDGRHGVEVEHAVGAGAALVVHRDVRRINDDRGPAHDGPRDEADRDGIATAIGGCFDGAVFDKN